MLTIDASVLVAATLEDEAASPESRELLRVAGRAGVAIHEPAIAVVEVAAGVARRTGRRDIVASSVRLLLALPGARFHQLDVPVAVHAAGHAADLGLRAGDALYAALAHEVGCTLVTLDRELLERASGIVDVCTPGEWLARQGG